MNKFLKFLVAAYSVFITARKTKARTQNFVKNASNKEYRDFKKQQDFGYAPKSNEMTLQQLKWLKIIEKSKSGKLSKEVRKDFKQAKYLDTIIKENIAVKPIGVIKLKSDNNTIKEITIGYNDKTNKMVMSLNDANGHPIWSKLNQNQIINALNVAIRKNGTTHNITFDSKMVDMDLNQVPKKVQSSLAENFDIVAQKSFQSNPIFQKNTNTLPSDFQENLEANKNKIFNIDVKAMNVRTHIDAPYIQMEYKGTDAGHHIFRPLFGLKTNAHNSVFIAEERFEKLLKNQHIEKIAKMDNSIFLGQHKQKNELFFGMKQGKSDTIKWQGVTDFVKDENVSEIKRKTAYQKLVKNDFLIEKGTINLKNQENKLVIKHHVKGYLTLAEQPNDSKKMLKFEPLKKQQAQRILNEYKKDPNFKFVKSLFNDKLNIKTDNAIRKTKNISY